ncbi:amidase [Azospirillum rugosum]|uniref:Asp-tRNA(Asn)/Glu-tRNA(Gln) amidotransferase A subunit family amidase n=1 Tax=Azospirillum rugosum TaxID=416170 RepID=A0ABS4SL09_9PROT|nr:amidase [Azospirillum rugosum]MBP2293253.1 Asp-tRNA(Asn)/Glu-tRNA(Gln) amidotransferase A subunit family amidase [Azospirillum rugosum]
MTLSTLPACELVERLTRGGVTATEVAQSFLARIAECDSSIGAWQHLDPAEVLETARRLDAADVRGPLHGLPIAVKDIMDTHDMPTAYGSDLYRHHQPSWDAAVVAQLRSLGALVLGKTVTTEFAYFKPGKTANPWDVRRTPGGSSSGSAAAVAAGMAPIGLGSQTAASLIRPASYCGVVGFKPSFGRYSLAGIKPLAHSLDTLGWMARTVDDIDLIGKALSGRALTGLPATGIQGLRIGLVRTYEWPLAEPSTRNALETATELFRRGGATVSTVDLPEPFAAMADTHAGVMAFEAARALAFEHASASDQLSPQLRALLDKGLAIDESSYFRLQDAAVACRNLLRDLFSSYDVLLAPSAPGEAPTGLQATGDPAFSRMWAVLHVPCLTLPGLTGEEGMPVGIQLIGSYQCDDRLLCIAKGCMDALNGALSQSLPVERHRR